MPGEDQAPFARRLDATLQMGADAAAGRGREDDAVERVLKAIRSHSADFSHIRLAETEEDKISGRPTPRDDPAYLLLLFPEALSLVMADALKRTEAAFATFLAEAEQETAAALGRLEQAAEPRFEAAADRAFERASGVIRRHANDLEVLSARLHAEMAEHTARLDQHRATTKQFFDRLGAGLLASAEARVREDTALTAKATVAELMPQLREVVREVVQEEQARTSKGGPGLFRR